MSLLPAAPSPPMQVDANDLDERRLQVVAEQANGLRWQILLTAIIVAAIAWQAAPRLLISVWFVAVIVSREIRAVALARMNRLHPLPVAERLRRTVMLNVVIGAANGSAALFMLWLDPTLDAVLTMILVSWGAGAVSTSATVMPAFLAYASLLFVPTAVMWASTGSWLGTGVAALVLMFFGVQIRFAKHNLHTFEESFSIRLEKEALAHSLASERTELALARDAAVQANQEKSRFLAAASHDLRQPLQAMALNSGELARLPLERDARLIADEIGTSVEQLRSMLDGLLDVSKLDAGVVVPQSQHFLLDRLMEGMAGSFRPAAAARGLALRWECPTGTGVHTDPDLLRRMLANLVDNAIKYTVAGEVKVVAARDSDWVDVAVHDTGCGIAAADQSRIFEDLVQLNNPDRDRTKGHGLGLGIVRRLATLLNIEFQLESELGEGTTFRFKLPAAEAPKLLSTEPEGDCSLYGVRVLVLDDEAMLRGAYVNALGGLGCNVRAAGSIDEAVAQASEIQAQAAVIDYRLHGEDGFAALERLRAVLPALAAVMVTADTDRSITAAAQRHGVRLLRKPVDVPTLGFALSDALKRSMT